MNDFKKILNSLCCPICKGQIDQSHNLKFYHCVNDINHYLLSFTGAIISFEKVQLFDYQNLIKYVIFKRININGLGYNFRINLNKIDAEGRFIHDFNDKNFTTSINIFDFQNFNLDKAINKIKTIMLFQ